MKTQPFLEPGEVHLFYTRADQVSDAGLLEQYRDCLSPDEVLKQDRYLKSSDRHLSLVSRALVRYLVAGVTGQEPQAIDFSFNEYGKPNVPQSPDIHFNLSHSHGAAVCALSRNFPVGVDIEDISRQTNLAIANRFFSSSEAQLVSNAPKAKKKALFFDIWTLKEAYIKAMGKGLSIPLDSFSFNADGAKIQINFNDTGKTDPLWQFFQWRPDPGKVISTAVRSFEPIVFKPFRCIPFLCIDQVAVH